jgi:hypothetical protein
MKWIKLSDRMPLQNIDGEKVLVCRMLNDTQASQNPSILPTDKIHLCNANETWWMALPELPSGLENVL